MLKCPIYNQTRKELFENIREIFTFNPIDEHCFINLMNYSNGDTELALLICDYVNNCFHLRQHYFEPLEDNNLSVKTTCTRSGRQSRAPNRLIQSVG